MSGLFPHGAQPSNNVQQNNDGDSVYFGVLNDDESMQLLVQDGTNNPAPDANGNQVYRLVSPSSESGTEVKRIYPLQAGEHCYVPCSYDEDKLFYQFSDPAEALQALATQRHRHNLGKLTMGTAVTLFCLILIAIVAYNLGEAFMSSLGDLSSNDSNNNHDASRGFSPGNHQ